MRCLQARIDGLVAELNKPDKVKSLESKLEAELEAIREQSLEPASKEPAPSGSVREREEAAEIEKKEQRRRSLAVDGSAFEPGSPCHCDRRPGTEIARAPPLTTRARSSRSRVPRGKRSSRPTSSGAQGSRRSGGGLAPARRRAVALPASRVLSLGSALRGAALALLLCRERHDGSPAEARDSSGPRIAMVTG